MEKTEKSFFRHWINARPWKRLIFRKKNPEKLAWLKIIIFKKSDNFYALFLAFCLFSSGRLYFIYLEMGYLSLQNERNISFFACLLHQYMLLNMLQQKKNCLHCWITILQMENFSRNFFILGDFFFFLNKPPKILGLIWLPGPQLTNLFFAKQSRLLEN